MRHVTAIHLVPHTHWDREWYLPFQVFRMRLVELVDQLVDMLESQPAFAFTLDGQLATIDDYLEVRPEAEPRLRRLIGEGRLAVGPWQILGDEFCVSGETIVRNLETGWVRGEELGGGMPVGYLPDMFGHIAQMPQILARAGIGDCVVWRGVPAAIDHHAFWWSAPDGSTVLAEYLVGGYGNAAHLLALPDALERRIELFAEIMRPFFGEDDLLAMLGGDHAIPMWDTVQRIERVNRQQHRYRVRVGTLADYVRDRGSYGALPRWTGEMRSGARANLLPGVASVRANVKAACARAERLLARYAEPLQALNGGEWPHRLLQLAWSKVVANSAHDSICGCSRDDVAAQVLVRFAEAEQIARGLVDRAAAACASRLPRPSFAVLNPSPTDRRGLIELDVPIPEDWKDVALRTAGGQLVATQEVSRDAPLLLETSMPGDGVASIFDRMHGRELFGRLLNGYRIETVGGRRRITYEVDTEPDPLWLDVDAVRSEVATAARAASAESWDVRIVGRPRRTLRASVTAPPLGVTAVTPVPERADAEEPVSVEDRCLDNGLVRVAVADDGTVRLQRDGVTLDGVGRLVDGGDAGDSYNYAPPARDTVVDEPADVRVRFLDSGPVTGRIAVTRTYPWPDGLDQAAGARTSTAKDVDVATVIELRAGEPFVRFHVDFDNPCADHRLRFHVPLPTRVDRSWAEGQFAVVERGLQAEGGHGERPLPTYPARGFVAVPSVAVLLDHLTEYEVAGSGTELALTLLRATGMISRNTNPYREEPAGPEVAIPAAQRLGPHSISFALYPHPDHWTAASVLDQMERYQHPFVVAPGAGSRQGPPPTARLRIDGDNVALSALRRRDGWLEARLVCQQPRPSMCTVGPGITQARDVDLLGRPGEALEPTPDGRLRLQLGAWEIRTVQFRR